MNKPLIYFTFLLCSTLHSFGQVNLKYTNDSDTTFWYNLKNNYTKKFKLGLIENDTAKYVFCFWSNGLVIKLLHQSNNNYSGEVIRFVEQSPEESKKKIFLKKYLLLPQDVYKAINFLDSIKLNDLPQ